MKRISYRSILVPLFIACALLSSRNFFSSAASFYRTSLEEMTSRAAAVAEVTVLRRSYPAMQPGQFPRTHIEVSINKALKGNLPATLTLDLPGAVHGTDVYSVPDSADFAINERAIVFIKEPAPGVYMVQDLGLGKFNVVERNNEIFVESALCPKAVQQGQQQPAADLLTKAIPYATFCTLVSGYANNAQPTENLTQLAMTLPNSGSHVCNPNGACGSMTQLISDARQNATAAAQQRDWLGFILGAGFVLSAAFAAVTFSRRRAARNASLKSVAMVLGAALLSGAFLGGSYSLAYKASGPIWNLDANQSNKVANGKVLWKSSSSVARTNANCFADVQSSFDKWASISGCRLAFQKNGETSANTHSSSDSMNFVAWNSNPGSDFSRSTLAITYSYYSVGSGHYYFMDCDIIFNDKDFGWSTGAQGNVKSVSLHEIGHFIGLDHVNNTSAVMNPYDTGLTNLSNDELAAARYLYPGTNTPPTPPVDPKGPTAVASGSPLSGAAPLNCAFDATGTTAGDAQITAYAWTFGDGSTGTSAHASHTYNTAGTYTVRLTVTDANGKTSTDSLTVVVTSSGNPNPPTTPTNPQDDNGLLLRGNFSLRFNKPGADAFSALIYTPQALSFGPSSDVSGVVTVGSKSFGFSYSSARHRSYSDSGVKVTVIPRASCVNVTINKVDLQSALASCGATNDNTFGKRVEVPISVIVGDGSQLELYTTGSFYYRSQKGKTGTGKF